MHYEMREYPVAEVIDDGQKPQRVNASLGQGCCAVIVAIIVAAVVAGIVVALGLPLLAKMKNDAKWAEGKVMCGMTRQALDVYKAKNSGKLPDIHDGLVVEQADLLRLDAGDFHTLKHFNAEDFRLTDVDAENGMYCIEATSSHPDGPPGTYRLWFDGFEEGP